MALPTPPTATTICTRALTQAGYDSPSASQIATTENDQLRQILRDLFDLKDWAILEFEDFVLLSNYIAEISVPTSMKKLLWAKLVYGTHAGTLQAGAVASVTLASSETFTDTNALGQPIIILSGVASGQKSRIVSYNATTKIAGVIPSFTVAPSTATYLVPDVEQELYLSQTEFVPLVLVSGPTKYSLFASPEYMNLNGYVDNADYVYAIWRKYTLDIDLVDLTDARMTRIYKKYQALLIQGVAAYILRDDDDSRYTNEMAVYEVKKRLAFGVDANERFQRVATGFGHGNGLPN